mgnify:CR=1 FL=1
MSAFRKSDRNQKALDPLEGIETLLDPLVSASKPTYQKALDPLEGIETK